jgi:hypothetical protein
VRGHVSRKQSMKKRKRGGRKRRNKKRRRIKTKIDTIK